MKTTSTAVLVTLLFVFGMTRSAEAALSNSLTWAGTTNTNVTSSNNWSASPAYATNNSFNLSNSIYQYYFTNSYSQLNGSQTFSFMGSNAGGYGYTFAGYSNVLVTNVGTFRLDNTGINATNASGTGTVTIWNTNSSQLTGNSAFSGNMAIWLNNLYNHSSTARTVANSNNNVAINNLGVNSASQTTIGGANGVTFTWGGTGTMTVLGTIMVVAQTNTTGTVTNNGALIVSSGTINIATTNAANIRTTSTNVDNSSVYGWNSGLVISNSGSVYVGGQNSLGVQAYDIKMGGTNGGTTTFGLFNSNNWATNATNAVTITNNFVIGNATANGTATNLFTANGSTKSLTLSGTISNSVAGNTLAVGTGTLTLSGNNTGLSEAITILSGGVLVASNANALGTGAVTVNSGASLNVLAAIANSVTNSSGATVNIQSDGSLSSSALGAGALTLVGTLGHAATFNDTASGTNSIGAFSINGYGTVAMSLGTTTKILSSGTITIAGTNNYISLTNGIAAANTYNLMTGSALTLTSSNISLYGFSGANTLSLGSSYTNSGTTYTFTNTATALQLIVTSGTLNYYWTGLANNEWSTAAGATNWQVAGTGSSVAFVNGGNVFFTNSATVSVTNTGINAGTMTLTNGAATTVAISGGAINATSLTASGTGTATIDSAMTLSSGATINSGTVTTTNMSVTAGGISQTGGSLTMNGSTTVTAGGITLSGGSMTASGSQTITAGGLSVSGATLTENGSMAPGAVTLGSGTINGSGTLTGSSYAVSGTGNSAVSAVLAGSGPLTKSGSGTVTLTGANTYSGGTTVSAGTLAGTTAGLQAAITNNSLVIFDQTFSGTYSGVMSGSGAITKNGTGTVTLSGANTNTGVTTVNAGTLAEGVNNALGSNAVTVNGGTFDIGNYSDSVGAVTLGAGTISGSGGTLTGTSYNLTSNGGLISANLAGSAALNLTNGSLITNVLSGSNSYSGGTTVTGASNVLSVTSTNAISKASKLNGSSSSGATAFLDLAQAGNYQMDSFATIAVFFQATNGAATLTFTNTASNANTMGGSANKIMTVNTNVSLVFQGGMDLSGTNATRILTLSGGGNVTMNGSFNVTNSNTASITKDSTSTGILTLANSNSTYNGLTTVSAGVLNIQNSLSLGTSLGGTNADGTFIANNAALQLQGGITIGSETLSIAGLGTNNDGALRNMSGANAYNGVISLATNTRFNSDAGTLTIGSALLGSQNLTVGGAGNTVLSAASNAMLALTKDGAGTLTLTGNNTNSGTTTITAGTLQLGNGATTGSLGTGAITNSGSLIVNRSDAVTMNNLVSGTGSLSQNGSGTVTLGGANSYSGGTAVNNGALVISATNGIGIGGTLSVLNGSRFTDGSSAGATNASTVLNVGALTIGGGSTITFSNLYNTITSSGTVTFTGDNNIISLGNAGWAAGSDSNNQTSYNLITGTSLSGASASSLLLNVGNTNIALGSSGIYGRNTYTLGTNATAVTLSIYGGAFDLNWSGALNNAWNTTDANWQQVGSSDNITFVSGDNVNFTTLTTTNIVVDAAGISAGILGVSNSSGTLSISGGTLTASSLNMSGAGALVLSNTTSVGAGTVSTGAFTNAGNMTVSTGGFTVSGGAATFNGTNVISAGGLTVSSGSLTQAGATTVTAGGVAVSGTGILTGNSAMTISAGGLTVTNGGTVTLNSTNSITGGVTLQGGSSSLTATANGALGAGALTVDAGTLSMGAVSNTLTTLTLSNNGTISGSGTLSAAAYSMNSGTVGAVLAGTGSLTKSGAGTVTLNKANTYSGVTTVSAGTLAYGIADALGAGSVTVNGGVLDLGSYSDTVGVVTLGSGTIASGTGTLTGTSYALTNSGTITAKLGAVGGATNTLTKSGAGTALLSGSNSYNGVTTVSAGTLQLGNSNALGTMGNVAADYTTVTGGWLDFNGQTIGTELVNMNAGTGGGLTNSAGSGSLAGALWLTNSSGNFVGVADSTSLTLSGVISGTGSRSLTKSGTGTLVLSGGNAFSGAVNITEGKLLLGNSSALGGVSANQPTNVIVSSGATLDLNGISTATNTYKYLVLNGSGVGANGNLINGSSTNATWNQALVLSNNSTIGASAGQLTVAGNIYGSIAYVTNSGGTNTNYTTSSFALTKVGTGTLVLSGSNAYTGGTTVNGGTVSVANSNNIGNGAVTLSGSSTNFATLRDTAVAGATNSSTVLNMGALTLNGYSTLSLVNAYNTVTSSGALSFSGTSNSLYMGGAWSMSADSNTPSVYTLLTGTSISGTSLSLTGSMLGTNSVALGSTTTIGRNTYSFYATNSTSLAISVWGAPFNLSWSGADELTPTAWNDTATNWVAIGTGDTNNIAFVSGDNVTFGIGTSIAVDAAGVTAGILNITNNSGTVALSGGSITAKTLTNSGTATIDNLLTITNGGLAVTTGSLTLNSNSIITNGVAVSGGGLVLNASNTVTGAVSVTGASTLTLATNGAVSGSGTLTLDNGTIAAGSGLSYLTNAVSVQSGGATITNDSALTLGGAVTGSNNVITKNGSGVLTLTNALGATTNSGMSVNVNAGSLVLTGSQKNFGGTSTFNGNVYATNVILSLNQNAAFNGTGTVSVDGGTVQTIFGSTGSNSVISNNIAFANSVALAVGSGKSLELSGLLYGSGSLTSSGSGALILDSSTAGTFSGTLTVNHTNNSAGFDMVTSQSLGNASSVVVNTNAARASSDNLRFINTVDGSFATVISGAGNVGYQLTNATLTLTTNNTYTGLSTITSGTLRYGNNNALASGAVTVAGGTLDLSSYTDTVGAVTLSSGSIIGSGILTGTSYALTGSGTVSAGLAGSGVALTKSGNSTTALLSGTNTYDGVTTITGGTLQLGNTYALGATNAGVNVNGGILDINGKSITGESMTNSATSSAITNSSSSNASWSGAVVLAQTGTNNFGVDAANGSLTISGAISGSSSRVLVKSGTGVLNLEGNNTNSGAISINAGTLGIGNIYALGSSTTASNVTVADGATLDLTGQTALSTRTISIAGTGVGGNGALVNSSDTAATMSNAITLTNNSTIGGNGAITLSGAIGDGGSAYSLTKSGAGTLILSATNSYSGGSTISAGTLQIGAGGTTGSIAGNITNNSVLAYNRSDASTASNNISGSGSVVQNGSGTLFLSGSNLVTGGLRLNSSGSVVINDTNGLGTGTITAGNAGSKIVLSSASGSAVTIANDINTGTNSSYTMAFTPGAGKSITLNGVIAGSGLLKISTGGDLYVSNILNTYSGGTEIGTGRMLLGNGAGLGTGAINFGTTTNSYLVATADATFTQSVTVGSLAVTNTANIDTAGYDVTLNSGISDKSGSLYGILNKLGEGSLFLNGTNSYSGSTAVNAGSLSLGSLGSLTGTTNVLVNAGSTLLLGASNQVNSLAPLSLNGTLSMGANGSTRAATQTFASLTLTGNSVIDFANLSGTSSLTFGSITGLSGNTLAVWNWNGTALMGSPTSTTGGVAQYTHLFDTAGGLTDAELANISFYSGDGTGFMGTGAFSSGNEIVPVPEPGVVVAGLLLIGWVLFSQVPRLRKLRTGV